MADGLALAGGVAIEGGLADGIAIGGDLAGGVAIGEDLAGDEVIEEALDDVGVDGELSASEEFSKRELSLVPATHSQSTFSLRPRTTFAFRWKDPEANPSQIVWTVMETLPKMRNFFPQKENF